LKPKDETKPIEIHEKRSSSVLKKKKKTETNTRNSFSLRFGSAQIEINLRDTFNISAAAALRGGKIKV